MDPPSGLVTLLFTDIEGSTRWWEAAPDAMRRALEQHDSLVRTAIEARHGYVFKTVGDAFCAAFAEPTDALRAAISAQRELGRAEWPDPVHIRVRVGLHTGRCFERDGDYFGPVVNRVARLEAAAHGGQVVVSAATARLIGHFGADIELVDLGHHRLKDLGAPEHIFTVIADGLERDFPPLRTLDSTALRNNLPEQLSEFVGREHEFSEILPILMEERLLTLVGPGGAGKTRLALQLAADLLDGSGDGVWFIELASITDPDLVPARVASAMRIHTEAGQNLAEVVVETLSQLDILLILDNCEQVIDACAKFVYSLLRSGPRVHILATSREPLGVEGERVYRVPSLRLPAGRDLSADSLLGYDAIRLFVDRATRHQPGFVLDDSTADDVVALCRQLDGMPLAIELAAARMRTMTVAQIRTRVAERFRLLVSSSRTAPARQQTLRATVDWSYELLSQAEREVVRSVSVFVGGFDLQAASAVVTVTAPPWEVEDMLAALVDRSLVQADSTASSVRFSMLETIRQYAADHLREEGPRRVNTLRQRHAAYFLRLAEEIGPGLRGPAQVELRARIRIEEDNLKAAIAYLLDNSRDPRAALRLACALRPYWQERNDSEILRLIRTALAHPHVTQRDWLRAQSLCFAGVLVGRDDPVPGRALLEEGLQIANEVGADRVAADCMQELSWAAMCVGDTAAAAARIDQAVAISTSIGDRWLLAQAFDLRAICDRYNGDLLSAKADHARAIEMFRDMGDLYGLALSLVNFAMCELDESDLASARQHLMEAERIEAELGFDRLVLRIRLNLGTAALLEGDTDAANDYYSRVLVDARRAGDVSAVGYAILGLALIASATNDHNRAAVLHGASAAVMATGNFALDTLEAQLRDRSLEKLRAALADGYGDAYAEGRSLDVQGAVGLALKATKPPR